MAKRLPDSIHSDAFRAAFARYLNRKIQISQLTEEAFGQRCGLSQPIINYLRRGHRIPSRVTAARIGEAFEEPDLAMIAAGYLPRPGMRVSV